MFEEKYLQEKCGFSDSHPEPKVLLNLLQNSHYIDFTKDPQQNAIDNETHEVNAKHQCQSCQKSLDVANGTEMPHC